MVFSAKPASLHFEIDPQQITTYATGALHHLIAHPPTDWDSVALILKALLRHEIESLTKVLKELESSITNLKGITSTKESIRGIGVLRTRAQR